MRPYFNQKFGNTMSPHSFGHSAAETLEKCRAEVAGLMGAKSGELVFTSSATESNNMVLKGVAFANRKNGNHIIISAIEHHSILDPAKWLQRRGYKLTILPVDEFGLVDPAQLANAIKAETILVSIMHANNEIGTIEPIEELGKICREHDVLFHTDAAQTFGKIEVNVNKVPVDMLTVSSHKMYGPPGVAGLFIRSDVKDRITPLLHGGGHEFGLRSSTVNLPGVVGFAKACAIAKLEMKKELNVQTRMRDKLIKGVLQIENSHLNGHPTKRLPNNANFWFDFIEGESLVVELDQRGIAASTGSACSSESLEPSHVLLAIGLRHEQAHGSLRLSIGRFTKRDDVNYALNVLPEAIARLREISPFKK
jgi:cysteine desulfurase